VGVFGKISKSVSSPLHRLLDRLEDPAETYELARTRQKEMLAEVRDQLAEDEAERLQIEARLPAGRRDEAGGPASRYRILVREEAKLRELEARLQDRISEFGSLIESAKVSKVTGGGAGDVGDDSELRAMTEQVEAELRRLDEQLRRKGR
jgi:hypothetical protein